jgi:hypothetical protein
MCCNMIIFYERNIDMMADFEPWEKEMENGVYYGQNREFFEEEYVDGDTNDKISW